MMFDKPYYNGVDWVVAEKNKVGLLVHRHKFENKEEAENFYNTHTQQPKATKAVLGGSENK